MKSARLLGHAVHPMVIVIPLGLFATALVFDDESADLNAPDSLSRRHA